MRQQLLKAGIIPESIPNDWVVATIAAFRKWVHTTKDGAIEVTSLLQLESARGSDEMDYTVFDDVDGREYRVRAEDIVYLRGVVVNGQTIPLKNLCASRKTVEKCDDCGIAAHCIKEVLDPLKDRHKSLCNQCITYHDHPRVSEQGGYNICKNCTALTCSHHPDLAKTQAIF